MKCLSWRRVGQERAPWYETIHSCVRNRGHKGKHKCNCGAEWRRKNAITTQNFKRRTER